MVERTRGRRWKKERESLRGEAEEEEGIDSTVTQQTAAPTIRRQSEGPRQPRVRGGAEGVVPPRVTLQSRDLT